jgi:hypothetical protein
MPQKLEIISQAELARRLNVTQSAVHNAVKNKRITLRADGKVNYPVALAEWKSNTDPARAKVQIGGSTKPIKPKLAKLDAAALSDIKKLLESEGFDTSNGLSHELVRTAEALARARERMLRIAVRRGELIELRPAQEHGRRIAIGFKRHMEGIPARYADNLAATLKCDPHQLEHELLKVIRASLDDLASTVGPPDPRKAASDEPVVKG